MVCLFYEFSELRRNGCLTLVCIMSDSRFLLWRRGKCYKKKDLIIWNFCRSAGDMLSSIASSSNADSSFVKLKFRRFNSWLICRICGNSSSADWYLLCSLISLMILSFVGWIFRSFGFCSNIGEPFYLWNWVKQVKREETPQSVVWGEASGWVENIKPEDSPQVEAEMSGIQDVHDTGV